MGMLLVCGISIHDRCIFDILILGVTVRILRLEE